MVRGSIHHYVYFNHSLFHKLKRTNVNIPDKHAVNFIMCLQNTNNIKKITVFTGQCCKMLYLGVKL